MELERQMKLEHLKLLVRVKNLLTTEQQQELEGLRPRKPGPPAAAPHPRP
jgi:hypothetical protein